MESAELETVLGTVHELLVAHGHGAAAELVKSCPARAENTAYDNWNGGTEIWQVRIEVPPADFGRLGAKRAVLEQQITNCLTIVLEIESHDWYSAKIVPAKVEAQDWRSKGAALPRQVRVKIVDELRLAEVEWNGTLNEVEFLGRLFDLAAMPSLDARFQTAAADIWQHRVNNCDWPRDWVYTDSRLQLLDGPHERFLEFLCEVVNPLARPDRDEALKLVAQFNDHLRSCGWEILEEERVAGRPRFAYHDRSQLGARTASRARSVADALDSGWMRKRIEQLERSIETDPDGAIGTAKELVEACCKSILEKRGVAIATADDLGTQTKKLAKALQLVPEGVTDAAKGANNIRRILQNLTQLTHHLAELRGLYGTGHGRDSQFRGLQPRHARLAVAAAVAFIDFVSETHRHRPMPKGT